MAMTVENVIQFRKNMIFEEIEVFLKEVGLQSEHTKTSYESRLRKFFIEVKPIQKKLEHLTIEDITCLKRKDIMSYRQELVDSNEYKNRTINHFFSVIKSFYNHLLINEYDVNTSIFTFKKLKETDSEEHGNFHSVEEAEQMAEMAFQTEREKKDLKRLLILFAIRTSLRIDEILNIKWKNFSYENGVYVVKTIGKGKKKVDGAITEKLYNELLTLKIENEDKVFNISEDAVRGMMKRLCKRMNIPKERNIVFHSFRSVAADWEMVTTGDIRKTADQLNHSGTDTLYKHYLSKNKDYTQVAGVRMEEDIDLSVMDNLSLEDFKEFIQNSDHKVKYDLVKFVKSKNL